MITAVTGHSLIANAPFLKIVYGFILCIYKFQNKVMLNVKDDRFRKFASDVACNAFQQSNNGREV